MFRDLVFEWIGDQLSEIGAIEEAAEIGYDTAIDMCGNDGQASVIDMTGYGAFEEAAQSMVDGGDGYGVLMSACPYPEAVADILAEAAGAMADYIDEATGSLFEEDYDDEGEDSDDDGGLFDF